MRSSSFFLLILGLLVTGAIGLLIIQDPELQTVKSDDGIVRVTGLARESQPFSIAQQDQQDPFTSSIYTIEPSGSVLETFAEIIFTEVLDDQGMYRFNDSAGMWTLQTQGAILETDQLGRFAIAPIYEIDAPEFASLRSAVHALAPENVVGYDILVGAEINGELFYLHGMDEQGGCDGGYALGNRIEQSQLEQNATVPVNGVERLMTFIYMADWHIQDAGGCGRADLAPVDSMVKSD